jgi:hypothetical protein
VVSQYFLWQQTGDKLGKIIVDIELLRYHWLFFGQIKGFFGRRANVFFVAKRETFLWHRASLFVVGEGCQ